jgi:hypothetical protein
MGLFKPGKSWQCFAAAGPFLLLWTITGFSQTSTPAVPCESLAKLALPDTTITLAQTVAAGTGSTDDAANFVCEEPKP